MTNSVSCDYSAEEATDIITACQAEIDEDLSDSVDEAGEAQSCCTAERRRAAGLDVLLDARAPKACPVNPDFPNHPPANGQYHSIFTCDYNLWPNVCANAQSAILVRNKPAILTYAGPGHDLHVTAPWYSGKWGSRPFAQGTKGGWGLPGCEVEEYPFGSGNPNRSPNDKIWNEQSVLRLIPEPENQDHGSRNANSLRNFVQRAGNGNFAFAEGLIYSVSFTNGPANPTSDADFYLDPNDQASIDKNYCAEPYGVAFLLVNSAFGMNNNDRSYDPWWDNKLFTKTTKISTRAGVGTVSVYTAATVSNYCKFPSPGRSVRVNGAWQLSAGEPSFDRRRGNA